MGWIERDWPEAEVAERLWADLDDDARVRLERLARDREVATTAEDAAITAWLQGRAFHDKTLRSFGFLTPVLGDLQFLLAWRLVTARARNLAVARAGGVIPAR